MNDGRVTCLACGQPNPPGKRFCGDCGTPLSLACPACGANNPPGKRFCGDCGATLSPAASPSPAPVPPPPQPLVLEEQFSTFPQALPAPVHAQVFAPPKGENRVLALLVA